MYFIQMSCELDLLNKKKEEVKDVVYFALEPHHRQVFIMKQMMEIILGFYSIVDLIYIIQTDLSSVSHKGFSLISRVIRHFF